MKNYVIIVAGGSGSRMNSNQPKQFLELEGRPMLMHTLDVFATCRIEINIILVLPTDHLNTWVELKQKHNYQTAHVTTTGGATRFDSVSNGLSLIEGEGIVAIHDGARPLVSPEIILRTFKSAEQSGNGIAAVQVKDSIRQVVAEKNKAVDRSQFYSVQTPQTFQVDIIKAAFSASSSNSFTDDASVAEAFGEEIKLVTGNYENLKITTPEDLIIATAILNSRK